VLYLAEVQKKSGVFGGGKAELKLLACQRGEQSWSAIPGEDIVPADEASNFNAGVLVLAELTASKQVQRVQEAGRQLVTILQNFSRQQEKYKTKEEEIEQWMQSLTFQSQELNRREMEMQTREEELTQLQQEAEGLESRRDEINSAREEADRLREEIAQKQQELDAAWEQLRSEKEGLEAQQQDLSQAVKLDDEQANHIRELLDYLSQMGISTEALQEQVNVSFETISAWQSAFDEHWQHVEQQRSQAQQLQEDIDRQAGEVDHRDRDWHEAQKQLQQTIADLQARERALSLKQEYADSMRSNLERQQQLHQQLFQMADTSEQVSIGDKVDVEALEKMPLEELQGVVQNLQQDLDKIFQFVNGQEEELRLQQDTIDELQQKLNQSGGDRSTLESELADEQEAYQMLNETLVGQRRNLRERQEILSQHQGVLARRLGHADGSNPGQKLALGPILGQMEEQQEQLRQQLDALDREISQLQDEIGQTRGEIDGKNQELNRQQEEIRSSQQGLLERRQQVAQMWGRVNILEEVLQPSQDRLNTLKAKLEELSASLGQLQEGESHQEQAIAQIREALSGLIGGESQGELAAS
jgi:chromosome segregation ATPase